LPKGEGGGKPHFPLIQQWTYNYKIKQQTSTNESDNNHLVSEL